MNPGIKSKRFINRVKLSGEKIYNLCLQQETTPVAIAAKADLSDDTIWRAMRGGSVLMKTAKAIARAMGVKVTDLAEHHPHDPSQQERVAG